MRQELYRSAGFYDSNYLCAHIDTDEPFLSFEKDRLTELAAATFMHEYIHYLQDITTTNGLMNICSEVELIKLLNARIREAGTLKVPYKPGPQDGNVYTNLEMRKVWIGSGTHRSYTGNFEIKTDTWHSGNYYIPTVILQWIDGSGEPLNYSFGSYCICESMAYEIEQKIYPGIIQPDAPDFPYRSARKLADKIYPGFTDNIEYLIALCDASLMYTASGDVFSICSFRCATVMKNLIHLMVSIGMFMIMYSST